MPVGETMPSSKGQAPKSAGDEWAAHFRPLPSGCFPYREARSHALIGKHLSDGAASLLCPDYRASPDPPL